MSSKYLRWYLIDGIRILYMLFSFVFPGEGYYCGGRTDAGMLLFILGRNSHMDLHLGVLLDEYRVKFMVRWLTFFCPLNLLSNSCKLHDH